MISEGGASTRIEFTSGDRGDTCVGHMFPSAGANRPSPCVVLGHGFTGTQDRLWGSAERFASEGIAAITFDYRRFGASGGEPRQVIRINDQLEDFRNAIAFARDHPSVDSGRIAIWGSSLGGAYVITLATEDPGIAAVVAQVPFNGFPRRVEGRSTRMTLRLLKAMVQDWVRGKLGREPLYIKAVGGPDELAVMTGGDVQFVIDAMQSDLWENRVAPRVLIEMMRYKPGKVAHTVNAPMLVCVGELDRETPLELQRELASGPRAELRTYPVSHFDFYRPDIRNSLLDDQAAFLKSALSGA